MSTAETYLTINNLMQRFKVSRTTVWRWQRKEQFPAPVKLSAGCARWKERAVDEWAQKRG